MDWIIWLVVIVVIVGVVWWLLNRNNARSGAATPPSTGAGTPASPRVSEDQLSEDRPSHDGALSGGTAAASAAAAATTGIPSAAGFGNAEPVPPTTADEREATVSSSAGSTAPESADVGSPDVGSPDVKSPRIDSASQEGTAGGSAGEENAEWETQWSETPPAEAHAATHHDLHHGAHGEQVAHGEQLAPDAHGETPTNPATGAAAAATTAEPQSAEHVPVHHAEYTEPHAPTLPGAESAAAEAAELETAQAASSAALTEGAASHSAAPAGHLAVEQPYGEGSAAPAPDGSGPEGFAVKGNASSMIYHDETSPSYEETVAEVWFLSAAHAEAAGFRPPRRSRI